MRSILRADSEGSTGAGIAVLFLVVLVAAALIALPFLRPAEVVEPRSRARLDIVPSVDTTAGNTIPAGSYDSCDAEAGGTTAEWTTGEGSYDPESNRFRARVAIDTDLAISAALFMEPNCLQMSFQVRVLDATDPSGDVPNTPYYVRIVSISRTILTDDNGSVSQNGVGFALDGETGDWLLLYRTDASSWVASCPEYRATPSIGSSCDWVRVGDHDGGTADTVFAYVILEDRGLWGYNNPGVAETVTIVYEFGSVDGSLESQTIPLEMVLDSRGTTNLS